jgi:hypothetical protein
MNGRPPFAPTATAGAVVVCPWCGQPTPPDYAHGHMQCLHCKTNIAPCCDGETDCAPPGDPAQTADGGAGRA